MSIFLGLVLLASLGYWGHRLLHDTASSLFIWPSLTRPSFDDREGRS